jgi:hypothetical protein
MHLGTILKYIPSLKTNIDIYLQMPAKLGRSNKKQKKTLSFPKYDNNLPLWFIDVSLFHKPIEKVIKCDDWLTKVFPPICLAHRHIRNYRLLNVTYHLPCLLH